MEAHQMGFAGCELKEGGEEQRKPVFCCSWRVLLELF